MNSDVVLLPGLHGTTRLFGTFVALAPPWARCLPLALPAMLDQSFEALAIALAPALRPLERFILVAESFSAPVAARLSEIVDTKVALLVLCNPLLRSPVAFPPKLAASLTRSHVLPRWAVGAAMTGGDASLSSSLLRELRNVPRQVLEKRMAAVASSVESDLTAHLPTRVLVILGTRDRLVSWDRTRAALGRFPFVRIAELPAPHLVIQSHPAEVWKLISEEFASAG